MGARRYRQLEDSLLEGRYREAAIVRQDLVAHRLDQVYHWLKSCRRRRRRIVAESLTTSTRRLLDGDHRAEEEKRAYARESGKSKLRDRRNVICRAILTNLQS